MRTSKHTSTPMLTRSMPCSLLGREVQQARRAPGIEPVSACALCVQVLDRYFGNVCELDLIFNFHKAYHILDELLISGELQEPSKKAILRVTAAQDALMEGSGDSKVSDSKYEI